MISICIPIYNYDVNPLVKKLSAQLELLAIPSEIILIDDHSDQYFKKINEAVCSEHVYIKLKKNIGRSAIRNKFLHYAKYNYLLFLDCDAVVFTDNFLEKYVHAIKEYPKHLICGGRIYPKSPIGRNQMLRWKYGVYKESKTYEERGKNPYKSFMTNNFLIPREIFQTVSFDERIVEYGHEDTLFGLELKKRKINIIHIDNPVLNGDIEDNKKFLLHTEKAVDNLTNILRYTNYDKELMEDVTLLHIYSKLYKVRKPIEVLFITFRPFIKWLLIKGYVNLYLFDFYKLGSFISAMNATQQKQVQAAHNLDIES